MTAPTSLSPLPSLASDAAKGRARTAGQPGAEPEEIRRSSVQCQQSAENGALFSKTFHAEHVRAGAHT